MKSLVGTRIYWAGQIFTAQRERYLTLGKIWHLTTSLITNFRVSLTHRYGIAFSLEMKPVSFVYRSAPLGSKSRVEYQIWWQGWPSGESTCLPPMWPGFDFPTRCHMWIEFVGSLLCYERFSPGYSGFPLSLTTSIWFDLWILIVKWWFGQCWFDFH